MVAGVLASLALADVAGRMPERAAGRRNELTAETLSAVPLICDRFDSQQLH